MTFTMGVGLPFNPYRAIMALLIAIMILVGLFTNVSDVPYYTKFATIKFVPTSYDWANHPLRFPVPRENMTYPPRGEPRDLPTIQHQFFREPEGEAKETVEDRREDVRRAFRRSWHAYEKYAWGKDELKPLSEAGEDNRGGWATSMVDALDTLWLMGMESEFHEAVRHVAQLDWNSTSGEGFDVVDATARNLGGLLAAYELSGEDALLRKAIELGDLLYAALDNEDHLPPRHITFEALEAGKGRPEAQASVAELAGMTLEFTRLSQLTDDPKYYDVVNRITHRLASSQNRTLIPGLWPTHVDTRQSGFRVDGDTFNFGADSAPLYRLLVDQHVFLQGQEPIYSAMYREAVTPLISHLFFRPILPNEKDVLMLGQAEVVSSSTRHFHAQLDHASCSAGATIAIAGKLFSHDEHVVYGDKLARACTYAYSVFPNRVMPSSSLLQSCPDLDPCEYRPNSGSRPAGFRVREGSYSLSAEAASSVFALYRVTGNDEWRDLAYDLWDAVKDVSRAGEAYAAVEDVTKEQIKHVDAMASGWMGETLKYFFLVFSDEDLLNLDKWVFNSAGHAMRRSGSS